LHSPQPLAKIERVIPLPFMFTPFIRSLAFVGVLGLFAYSSRELRGQTAGEAPAAVEGMVQDSSNSPLVGAMISIKSNNSSFVRTTTADLHGQYHFERLPAGTYTVRANLPGYAEYIEASLVLGEHEKKSLVLVMKKEQSQTSAKDQSSAIAFVDEPTFTVAGVTDTTALGGHGSGPVIRNSDALSKETVSLAHEYAANPGGAPNDAAHADLTQQAAAIRIQLSHRDDADLHAQLAEIEENLSHPLEAEKEYQRAAEMDPSEPHLFAWGAELLLHHAPEPAIEVFTKGHRLYPQSSRMLLGLGAAYYAERSKEQAEHMFLQACDLDPVDPTPYLFLGRLQVTQQIVSGAWTERMKRFVALHPEMAASHYLYAVALMKQDGSQSNRNLIESELKSAIKLNPQLGDAYLYLGILCSDIGDFSAAVTALQKAVELTPLPEDAHYRLAQLYRRMGETEKANQEIAQFKRVAEQKDAQAEKERHEIPQFVYTLRGQNPTLPPPPPNSH
jgi:tetratricopeptide (TPR) repeat protein